MTKICTNICTFFPLKQIFIVNNNNEHFRKAYLTMIDLAIFKTYVIFHRQKKKNMKISFQLILNIRKCLDSKVTNQGDI